MKRKLHYAKLSLALLAGLFVVSLESAHAVPVDCTAGAGFACIAEEGDVLAGGVVVSSVGGTDTEETVEAAILSATGTAVDISLYGASDDNPSFFSFSNFDTGTGLTTSKSGTWTVLDGTLISYVSVKAADGFKLFNFNPAVATGGYDTLGLINPGGQQPTVSHIRFWTAPTTPPPGQEVPEPASAALLLSALGSGALIRRRKK